VYVNWLGTSEFKLETDVALLVCDILDDRVCAVMECVGCLEEEHFDCCLLDGDDRRSEEDVCCLNEGEAFCSGCLLDF
jgi:hypothetical protein